MITFPTVSKDNSNNDNKANIASKQKEKTKIINSVSQPKGDIEMKNITYIAKEKRYIGRKCINKQTITVHAKTQLECRDKLRQAIKDFLSCKTKKAEKKKQITLSEFWDKWFEQDKKPFVSEKTVADFGYIKKSLGKLCEMPITKINKDNILDFFKKVKENRTKEKMHLYLNACLKSAVNHEIINKNPYDLIILAPRNHKHKEALTYSEQVKLLNYIEDKPIKIIVLIYILTGLRKNEFNFKSIEKDINFENGYLKAINLKGRNKEVRYKHIRLKPELISEIMNNLPIIKTYDAESAYRELSDIMKLLEINKSVVHLRHTFATNHLYLGTPEFIISKEMGHSTSQITKDNYMDIDFNLTKEKIIKLYNNLYPLFIE